MKTRQGKGEAKARQGEADVKVISGAAMSEAVLPANVEVNGA